MWYEGDPDPSGGTNLGSEGLFPLQFFFFLDIFVLLRGLFDILDYKKI